MKNKYVLIILYTLTTVDTNYADEAAAATEIITNETGSDGFGSQFQNVIATVIYAELMQKKFVYTPFRAMEHNYNSDPEFLAKKEKLINFLGNFEINEHGTATPYNVKAYFDARVAEYASSLSLQKIKKIFRDNKNKSDYRDPRQFNIAIHLRRPNPHDSRQEGSDTPDTIFLNIINALRAMYVSKNPVFHLHSQGSRNNFKRFKAPDIVLHLNEPLEDTFSAMVFADVLVVAASSLSYTAGILSDGIVYYMPFWHRPLPHWQQVPTGKVRAFVPCLIS